MGTLPSALSFGGEDVPNMWAREAERREEPTTMAALLPKDLMQCLQRADEPEAKVREAVKKQRERPEARSRPGWRSTGFSGGMASAMAITALTTFTSQTLSSG